MSLLSFQGRLLAGIGKALRIYDVGMRRLLRKVENKTFAAGIVNLSSQGSRIIVGDQQDSLFYAVYKAPENRLLVFADDSQQRWITSSVMMDYDTVAGADKFGNIFINRIEQSVSETVDADPTGASILHEKAFLMGAPHKSEMLAHYNVRSK
jgi:splicing factor 3B subunit 3